MKRILSLAAGLALLMGSLAPAAVITVSKNAADSANASTIGAAVDLASSGDTIRILDSALYSEDFKLPVNMKSDNATVLDSLTIEATGTPTLERPLGATAGPVIRFGPGTATTTVPGPYAIRGASPTAKLTIRQLAATNPCINTGANQASAHNITFENLTLEKPTDATAYPAASTQLFINMVCAGSQTLNNIDLRGRKTDESFPVAQFGCTQGTTVTANNVDFSGISGVNSNLINVIANADGTSGNLVFNNCKIMPNAASLATNPGMVPIKDNGSVSNTVTFNDCHFNMGGVSRGRPFVLSSDATWIINRPVFDGAMADVIFQTSTTNGGAADKYPTITVSGDPKNKFNFDDVIKAGTVLPCRVSQGTLNLIDCTYTTVGSYAMLVDTGDGVACGPATINMDRCIWGNNCGEVNIVYNTWDGTKWNPADSVETVAFNATNTIWAGATTQGQFIFHSAQGMTVGPLTVTLNHCTMTGKTANILLYCDPTIDPNPVANYCIFDSSQTTSKAANGSQELKGKGNICWAGDPTKTCWWVGEPADTIHGDPALNASGHISIDSLAGGAAIGSTETVDVDGQFRPLGGTTPDIGADETYAVPVELSGFNAE